MGGQDKLDLQKSSVNSEDAPAAFVKTHELTGGKLTVDGILGKVVEGRDGTSAKTNQGRYALCTGYGIGLQNCYFSVETYTAPGSPYYIEFYDATDVNKSIVAAARIECVKGKSVFKALIDFFLDPIITM